MARRLILNKAALTTGQVARMLTEYNLTIGGGKIWRTVVSRWCNEGLIEYTTMAKGHRRIDISQVEKLKWMLRERKELG
jgi:hypothetical protein